MTAAEMERRGKKIGSIVIFDIIMGIIVLASFMVRVVSDYVKTGFNFEILLSFSYWATLIADNVINIAMSIVFRSLMIDREKRFNETFNKFKGSIEDMQKFIYSNSYDNTLKEYVDKTNADRKYTLYYNMLKHKADKSFAKKQLDRLYVKKKYEEDKRQPNKAKIERIENKIRKYNVKYNVLLQKLAAAREESVWRKVRGYRPIKTVVLFSGADKISDNIAENYEVNSGKEFAFFFLKKVVFLLIFASFLGTLVPEGFLFDYTMLWGTANKIFWGAMSLYAGGSAGVEYVRQVLVPAVKGRVDFLQQFSETLPN